MLRSPEIELGPTLVDRVVGEVPAGTIDGANKVFTTANKFVVNTEAVFFCGVRMVRGASEDYTTSESGGVGTGYDTITFVRPIAPRVGDELLVDYTKV
jgi:hypothetical protein